jgi:hypothetical protein
VAAGFWGTPVAGGCDDGCVDQVQNTIATGRPDVVAGSHRDGARLGVLINAMFEKIFWKKEAKISSAYIFPHRFVFKRGLNQPSGSRHYR